MISVVIPHYKNKARLYANLHHNLLFLKECEIIVVNDYPEEPLQKEMTQKFPTILVIENEKNLGFAGTVAVGIARANNPYILLLNNDVLLRDDGFQKAVTYFDKDASLFAVSFRQIEKNGLFVGRNRIYWEGGFFQHSQADATKNGINGWAEGGSMLFDKKKYERINGFDVLYSPFYWEDIDLSYRAWKAGYTILFDLNITVQHHHETTIANNFSASQIKTIAYRNQFITIWKNISDGKMIYSHVIQLMKNLVLYPFRTENEFIVGFWMAFLLIPQIMKKKGQQKKLWIKSDKEIFEKFKII